MPINLNSEYVDVYFDNKTSFDAVELKINNETFYIYHNEFVIFKGEILGINSNKWKNYLKQQKMLKLRKLRY